ncbi:putative actin patch assembly and actin polymerization protein [Serendipita sp. 401]|nr:putative actin patch assembly and actin polymerization protein [Serendipita sp. 401]
MLSALRSDKPHSSISDWIDILSSENYTADELDGIPELVDSINLQASGPAEASRSIRKKLKYGNVHRQIRVITILKALVENGGKNFQKTFADERLIEQMTRMCADPHTDERVKKRIVSLFGGWHRQFKDDPSMRVAANLYSTVRPTPKVNTSLNQNPSSVGTDTGAIERSRKQKEKEERKAKEREAEEERRKTKQAQKEAAWNQANKRPNKQRKPFNFEQEKPIILTSIANASQCTNNLVNALKLVNREKESVEENPRVQETLTAAKAARKQIVRYVQLVENEELIGTLIDTNERIIVALDMYDTLLKTAAQDSDDTPPPSAVPESPSTDWTKADSSAITGQLERLQEKQRAAVERAIAREKTTRVHPDLDSISFDDSSRGAGLPPPIKPTTPGADDAKGFDRGSLSDFSDYDSSSDEAPRTSMSSGRPSTSTHRQYEYRNQQAEDDEYGAEDTRKNLLDDEDPFADPFADQSDVGTPGIREKGKYKWPVTA